MFHNYTLIELINEMAQWQKKYEEEPSEEVQMIINNIAFELTTRIYVPNTGTNFDDILAQLGYVDLNNQRKLK